MGVTGNLILGKIHSFAGIEVMLCQLGIGSSGQTVFFQEGICVPF